MAEDEEQPAGFQQANLSKTDTISLEKGEAIAPLNSIHRAFASIAFLPYVRFRICAPPWRT
jgi:hypothetical protein